MWLNKMWKLGVLAVAELLFDALTESLEGDLDHLPLADPKRTGDKPPTPKALSRERGLLILSNDEMVPLIYFFGHEEFSTKDFDEAVAATCGPDSLGDFHTVMFDQVPIMAVH